MRFLPLLVANLFRKKVRTTLTVGSFAVALLLFGLLAAVRAGFRQGIDVAGADRLVVIGRTGLIRNPPGSGSLRRGNRAPPTTAATPDPLPSRSKTRPSPPYMPGGNS